MVLVHVYVVIKPPRGPPSLPRTSEEGSLSYRIFKSILASVTHMAMILTWRSFPRGRRVWNIAWKGDTNVEEVGMVAYTEKQDSAWLSNMQDRTPVKSRECCTYSNRFLLIVKINKRFIIFYSILFIFFKCYLESAILRKSRDHKYQTKWVDKLNAVIIHAFFIRNRFIRNLY